MYKAFLLATVAAALGASVPAWALDEAKLTAAVRAEEAALPARVGAAILDTKTGALWR